jgi:hypothetical protein
MQNSEPRARHLWRLPGTAGEESTPSPTAQQRLTGALRDRADAYRDDASVDLALVDVLVRMDQLEAAAKTLDEHRSSLHALAQDLQVVVADAAVEREAERVYCTSMRALEPRRGARLRRRLVALTGAAAVFAALLLPSVRISPRTMLAGIHDRVTHDEVAAARERLEAARSTAAAVRAQPAVTPLAPGALRDPQIRRQVRAILTSDAPAATGAPADTDSAIPVLGKVRATRDRTSPQAQRPHPGGEVLAPVVPLRAEQSAPTSEDRAHDDGDHALPATPVPMPSAPEPVTPTD